MATSRPDSSLSSMRSCRLLQVATIRSWRRSLAADVSWPSSKQQSLRSPPVSRSLRDRFCVASQSARQCARRRRTVAIIAGSRLFAQGTRATARGDAGLTFAMAVTACTCARWLQRLHARLRRTAGNTSRRSLQCPQTWSSRRCSSTQALPSPSICRPRSLFSLRRRRKFSRPFLRLEISLRRRKGRLRPDVDDQQVSLRESTERGLERCRARFERDRARL